MVWWTCRIDYRQIFNDTYTTWIPTEFEYASLMHILAYFFFPEFHLCILRLPVLYVRQAESELIPIMKQTSLIEFAKKFQHFQPGGSQVS